MALACLKSATVLVVQIFRCRRDLYALPVRAMCCQTMSTTTRKKEAKEIPHIWLDYSNRYSLRKTWRTSQIRLQSTSTPRELDDITFNKLSDQTLDELAEFFEDLGDSGLCPSDFDVSLSSGVLTIGVGGNHGTYVINKQSPNRQIWLSSPKSGPKRYDVIDGRWRYSHNGEALHDILQREFCEITGTNLDLAQLKHSYLISDEGNWAT